MACENPSHQSLQNWHTLSLRHLHGNALGSDATEYCHRVEDCLAYAKRCAGSISRDSPQPPNAHNEVLISAAVYADTAVRAMLTPSYCYNFTPIHPIFGSISPQIHHWSCLLASVFICIAML